MKISLLSRCALTRVSLFLVVFLFAAQLWAVPAHRGLSRVQQPDSTFVTIRLCGDEWIHYHATSDGYTLVKNAEGYYVYAALEDGQLLPTGQVAHDEGQRSDSEQAFLAQMPRGLKPAMNPQVQTMRQEAAARRAASSDGRAASFDFNRFRGLIILAQYNDLKFTRTDYHELMDQMANKEGFTRYGSEMFTGSLRDYFSDNSNGRFKPEFDVVGPYTLDYSQYYAKGTERGYQLVRAAIKAADADVDYTRYDGDGDGRVDLVYVVFAGMGSNFSDNDERLIWPHRHFASVKVDGIYTFDYACSVELYGYSKRPETVKLNGIGTICHEFSHVLGLPDLYDTDYEESGGESNHPGDWSVMAEGCYANDDRTPVGYSLYERCAVGFMDEPAVLTASGSAVLDPLYAMGTQSGYRINTPVDKEFFLLENRQKDLFKWDAYLPGSGMLVHRVDKTNETVWGMGSNKVNANPEHNYYELLRAGGPHTRTVQMESSSVTRYVSTDADPFPGSEGVTELTNETTPANLLSWAGKPCGLTLHHIQMGSDGTITFDSQATETAIRELPPSANDVEAPLYNLHGQRVGSQHRGLLIQNGRKVIKY